MQQYARIGLLKPESVTHLLRGAALDVTEHQHQPLVLRQRLSGPITVSSTMVFAVAMGLTWLGTVPLTTGVVSRIFGVQYLATLFGFVFLGHQVGGFLGVWLAGTLFDATHSYQAIWLISIALGLFSAIVHLPIDDRAIALRGAAVQAARS